LVKNRELFGDLASERAFTGPYLNALNSLHTRGARATLEALVTRSTPS
jgi:mannitol 2-dehydrogenase